MCGICGTVRFDNRSVDRDSLGRGCTAQRHRGPDHSNVWISKEVAPAVGLGAVRLAVMDPSPSSHQPFHDDTGRYHLVYNGEVYNQASLRDSLAMHGFSFRTRGDTEVVLAACIHWGTNALTRLQGIWALAFYDEQDRTGFLARDPYGVKPLVYQSDASRLQFASELRALRAMSNIDRTVDEDALIHLLTFGYVADPATIYSSVRRLAPGHVLKFGAAGPGLPQPYAPTDAMRDQEPTDSSYAQACKHIRRIIDDAVVRQRLADVPTGALLSGGLDSSIIVHHLARVTSAPIKTFAVGYEGARTYDERAFARLIAIKYGTDHHELVVTEREALHAIAPLLDHLGEPFGDSSIIPMMLISQYAADHVTVALSGDGGDELFGGYWRYLGHSAVRALNRIPSFLRRFVIEPSLRTLGSSKTSRWANRVRQLRKLLRATGSDPIARHVEWCSILAPDAMQILKNPERVAQCKEQVCGWAYDQTRHVVPPDPLNRILEFDRRYQLPSDMLQKVDLAGMANSLEVRVPLLDSAVVDAARQMHSHYKVHKGLRKRLLVDAYRGHLPDEVLDRGKQGFEIPMGEYLRGPLLGMFHDVVTPQVIDSFGGLLSYPGVHAILNDHVARRGEHADLLFTLLSLAWWRRSGG